MLIKFDLTETVITVSKRDGSSVDVELGNVPGDMWEDFAVEGIAEYIRDASASALINAYRAAHNGDDGTVDSRKEWAEANTAAIAAESARLMAEARDAMYGGERTRRTGGGGSSADPLDKWRVAVVRDLIKAARDGVITDKATVKALAALSKEYDSIPSDDQPGRRAVLLSFATANAEAIDPMATESMERDRAAKAEAAKRAAALAAKLS